MMFRRIARRVSIPAALALLPASLLAIPRGEQIQIQKEGVQLIRQVEEVARDVHYHAERLNSFKRSVEISRWTHVHHLREIKDLVNDGLRPALMRLKEIQPQLPDWKQHSINTMLQTAKMLAADSNDAILTKKESATVLPVMNDEYQELVARIYQHAEFLVKTSDAAGEYASAHLEAQEAGLTVPRS
jgi:hypothetical protein